VFPSQAPERLASWKAIAAYLGCDERTAQRWEAECGLPVHRTPGRKRGSVFAFRTELDEWLKNGKNTPSDRAVQETNRSAQGRMPLPAVPSSQAPKNGSKIKYLLSLGAIGTLFVVCSIALFRSPQKVAPTKITFTANAIQALDSDGQRLWSYNLPNPIHSLYLNRPETLTNLVRIGDFRRDGNREVLVALPLKSGPNPSDPSVTQIDCFSSAGHLLWSYVPHEKFQFGTYDLRGPWGVFDILVSNESAKPTIWASLVHYEWGNSFVVQLDPTTGKATERFVNTGIIYKLNELRVAGKLFLLAGGFNNEYARGSLAVMDENKPFAVSPQTPGTRHECVSCAHIGPDYYFVFPRSEINMERQAWEDSIEMINVNGDQFEVWKMELGETGHPKPIGSVRSVYVFRSIPRFEPYAFRFDSSY